LKITLHIVDDDDLILFIYKKMIETVGWNVSVNTYRNGKEFVDYLSTSDIDSEKELVILDLNMPVLDGWGVLDFLNYHERSEKFPTVVVSSSINKSEINKACEYPNVYKYIQKPVSIRTIQEIIQVFESIQTMS
jgi:CheY-like chemotaxis protein